MRKKRDRGYSSKKHRSNRMYAPCRTGKDVTDAEVSDLKYWVARIRAERGKGYEGSAVTLEEIRDRRERLKLAA